LKSYIIAPSGGIKSRATMPSLLIILLATFSVVTGNNNSKQTGEQITVKS